MKEQLVEPCLEIIVKPNGDTEVLFMPVEFSEYVIDYILPKEERDRYNSSGFRGRKIYCG